MTAATMTAIREPQHRESFFGEALGQPSEHAAFRQVCVDPMRLYHGASHGPSGGMEHRVEW